MNLSPSLTKSLRILLSLPAIAFGMLAVCALFIPYQSNPRYFPLPIHFGLYALWLWLASLFFEDKLKNSRFAAWVIMFLACLFPLAYAIEFILVALNHEDLFSSDSKFMAKTSDLVIRIIVVAGLRYFDRFNNWFFDRIFREPAKP